MPASLALTIDGDRIGLPGLGQAVVDFSELLTELDAALFPQGRATVHWELAAISYSSPVRILATAVPSQNGADRAPQVAEVCIAGARALTDGARRPPGFSDEALQRIGRLGELTGQGIRTIRITDAIHDGRGGDDTPQDAIVTAATAANAAAVLAESTDTTTAVEPSVYGSVEGPAEAFNVHAAPFFTVWDLLTGKAVQCYFDASDRERIADIVAERRTVSVSGPLRRNPDGSLGRIRPVDAIEVIDEPLPGDWAPPTGLFGGVSDTQAYLRNIRGE